MKIQRQYRETEKSNMPKAQSERSFSRFDHAGAIEHNSQMRLVPTQNDNKTIPPLKGDNTHSQDFCYHIAALNLKKKIAIILDHQKSKININKLDYQNQNVHLPAEKKIKKQCDVISEQWQTHLLNNEHEPQNNQINIITLQNEEDWWVVDIEKTQQIWMERYTTHVVAGFNFCDRHEQKVILPIKEWGRLEHFMGGILNNSQNNRWHKVAFSPVFICLQRNENALNPLAKIV